jgi:hypothetical protein
MILWIQYRIQSLPPTLCLITAVGDDHNLYVFITLFHPLYDFYQFSGIDGIAIIATKGYLFGLFDYVAEIMPEPI